MVGLYWRWWMWSSLAALISRLIEEIRVLDVVMCFHWWYLDPVIHQDAPVFCLSATVDVTLGCYCNCVLLCITLCVCVCVCVCVCGPWLCCGHIRCWAGGRSTVHTGPCMWVCTAQGPNTWRILQCCACVGVCICVWVCVCVVLVTMVALWVDCLFEMMW